MDVLNFEEWGKALIFKKLRPRLRAYFRKAGHDEVPYKLFGILFYVGVAITLILYFAFIYLPLTKQSLVSLLIYSFLAILILLPIILGLILLVIYINLDLKVYKRTKLLEEALPEYLTLVSVNLKGGMAFEQSLWTAIKPEFDVLAKEITVVSKSVMTGNDVKDALTEFAQKYDSSVLRRSMDLLVGEIDSGGRIVDVIDNLIANLKKTQALRRELIVATTTYSIFITAIVVVIAPVLFAVAYQLLSIMTGFSSSLGSNTQNLDLPFSFGGGSVSTVEFRNFSFLALGIISAFSSMIISIIRRGDIKGGVKLIPVFVISACLIYYGVSFAMNSLFSGFV